MHYKISLLSLLCSLTLVLCACGSSRQSSTEPVSNTGMYFDTVITLTLYPDSSHDTASLNQYLNDCFQMADRYEKMLSRTKENSDIWKLNHAAGKPVIIEADTVSLLSTALSYAKMTDGKVDPSIGAVSEEWDFSSDEAKVPPDTLLVQEKLSHVNYNNIEINGNTVTLTDPDMVIDLGFIAKGYIADQMKKYLLSKDIQSGIINLGGNVLTLGNKPDKTPYKIGIQKPFAEQGESLAVVSVSDASVVSSGCYERYFEYHGKRYFHILDTATGFPVENNLYEVTILSPGSVDGDALSTTCFCLGLEEGMKLVESLPNTEAIFVTNDEVLHFSSGLSEENLVYTP